MLTEEEQREIDAEAANYPVRRSVAIDALNIVQRHRGYISDETLSDIAAYLGLTPDELDGVSTFYNLLNRQPVGRHVIHLCDGITCYMCGHRRLERELEEKLGVKPGETTADGRFTLLPVVCLGACDHAPVMMVDDDLHRDLDPKQTPGRIEEILEGYK